MAEIINLNQFRKSKQRRERLQTADNNRAKSGRLKSERQRDDGERDLKRRGLEQRKLTPAPGHDDPQGES